MRRSLALAGGLSALLVLAGCQTWHDKADAKALTDCAKIADAGKRTACQTEIMTAAGDAERNQLANQRAAAKAREDRDALLKAYGIPKSQRPD